MVKCNLCDKQTSRDKVIKIKDGVYICQECFDEYFVICEECGKCLYILYDTIPVYGGYYFICSNCYEKGYKVCEICKKILPKDEVYYDKKRKMYICIYCLGELNYKQRQKQKQNKNNNSNK